jgi:hypothetical protein
MKAKYTTAAIAGLLLATLGTCAIALMSRRIDAGAGVIRFPFYQGTATMDSARDMIFDLGWTHVSESGTSTSGQRTRVTFEALDRQGKTVTLVFTLGLLASQVEIATDENSEYSRHEVTRELARRLGMRVEARPLSDATADLPASG